MKYILLVALLFLQGCAQMIPAKATRIESGVYMLQATGNMFASTDSLRKKVDKKAESVCAGKGFDDLSSNAQWQNQQFYNVGVVMSAGYQIFNKRIKCKE